MDEIRKSQLRVLMDRDKAARTEKREKEAANQAVTVKRTSEWQSKIPSLKRSLDELLKTLEANDWQTSVSDLPNGFKVSLGRGNLRVWHSGTEPFVTFTLESNSVAVRLGTPSSSGEVGSTPDAVHSVDEVVPDIVHGHILDLLEILVPK